MATSILAAPLLVSALERIKEGLPSLEIVLFPIGPLAAISAAAVSSSWRIFWLSWRTGLETGGRSAFLSLGLPLTWEQGLAGLFLPWSFRKL
ncbi:MAG: hypothetical protein ACOYEK_06025 [bacterium]